MPNEYGLDTDYFIRLCEREFNPDVIRRQRPEDLARALARAARTACAEVLQEHEFQPQDQSDDKRFTTWWENDGQYLRSGGGDYEKTFAYHAFLDGRSALRATMAAKPGPAPEPPLGIDSEGGSHD